MKHLRTGRFGLSAMAAGLCLVALSGSVPAAEDSPPPATASGTRMVTGQVAIVGGNAAGARERALDEALRQAVEQALAEQLDAQTRAAQARAIKTLQGGARSYVKRYRTVDEGEANGFYNVRIEAEVDDAALRRATERWSMPPSGPAGAGGTARAPSTSIMVAVSGPADAGSAMLAALSAAGVRAQALAQAQALASDGGPAGAPGNGDPARALAAAAKASFSAVAFLSATVTDEGIVRGPGQVAVSCQLTARVVSVPVGQPLAEASAAPRSFADREAAARADCLARAATAIAPRLLPSAAASTGTAADLRMVVLDADVVEPSAVSGLLKTVRGLGSVSSADVRRIVPGRAELRVRTRLPAAALAAALSRETSAMITFSNVETSGDLIRLRARLRPPPSPSLATP
jgi:hypothetical protein